MRKFPARFCNRNYTCSAWYVSLSSPSLSKWPSQRRAETSSTYLSYQIEGVYVLPDLLCHVVVRDVSHHPTVCPIYFPHHIVRERPGVQVSHPYVRMEQIAASYSRSLIFTLKDFELKTLCNSPQREKAWSILSLMSWICLPSAEKSVPRFLKTVTLSSCPVGHLHT